MTSPPKAPPRLERRRVAARERLVSVALSLFESKGYEATTVAEIADGADMARATLFTHFPSKLDLLFAARQHLLLHVFQDVGDLTKARQPFPERLIALFEENAERAERATESQRALLRSMVKLVATEREPNAAGPFNHAIGRFLEEGQTSGELRSDISLETATTVVYGSWEQIFSTWAAATDYPLRERASDTARFLASVLCADPRRD